MTKKIFAVLLLSLAVSACESNSTETGSKANNANAKITAQASPTTTPSPSAEPSPSTRAHLKTGDKVRIMVNGSPTEATVVSVDENLGKVTVKVQSESKERTVAIAHLIDQ
jgi:protein involved in polysaccharide export with SLBB domain